MTSPQEGGPQPPEGPVTVSVLVPVWQEPEPLVALYHEYAAPLRRRGWSFEFIFICEPGFEIEIAQLLEQSHQDEPIRILQVAQLIDESSLYNAAGAHARGEIILTLPAYRSTANTAERKSKAKRITTKRTAIMRTRMSHTSRRGA